MEYIYIATVCNVIYQNIFNSWVVCMYFKLWLFEKKTLHSEKSLNIFSFFYLLLHVRIHTMDFGIPQLNSTT